MYSFTHYIAISPTGAFRRSLLSPYLLRTFSLLLRTPHGGCSMLVGFYLCAGNARLPQAVCWRMSQVMALITTAVLLLFFCCSSTVLLEFKKNRRRTDGNWLKIRWIVNDLSSGCFWVVLLLFFCCSFTVLLLF